MWKYLLSLIFCLILSSCSNKDSINDNPIVKSDTLSAREKLINKVAEYNLIVNSIVNENKDFYYSGFLNGSLVMSPEANTAYWPKLMGIKKVLHHHSKFLLQTETASWELYAFYLDYLSFSDTTMLALQGKVPSTFIIIDDENFIATLDDKKYEDVKKIIIGEVNNSNQALYSLHLYLQMSEFRNWFILDDQNRNYNNFYTHDIEFRNEKYFVNIINKDKKILLKASVDKLANVKILEDNREVVVVL